MYKNEEVLTFHFVNKKFEIVEVINARYLPLHLVSNINNEKISIWLNHRIIPKSREGIQETLGAARSNSRFSLSLKSHGTSLTDPYWIKKESSTQTWETVNLYNNNYSYDIGNLAFGLPTKGEINYYSPDSTTNGIQNKTWRRIDGVDYLYKIGTPPDYQEAINEVFSSKVAENFEGLDYVVYQLAEVNENICSVCANFVTEHEEFVPAYSVYQVKSKPLIKTVHDHLIDSCKRFLIPEVEDFINKMLVFDYIISNTDRHMGNFGFMRRTSDLNFTRPAPLFDNGTSLWMDDILQGLRDIEDIENMNAFSNKKRIESIKDLDFLNLLELRLLDDYLADLCKQVQMEETKRDTICLNYQKRVEEVYRIRETKAHENRMRKHIVDKDKEERA